MRVFLFVLASVMGANSAFAQSSALERATAAKRALTQCEDKAVKDKKAGSAFVARLGVCISQFRLARDLEAALMAGRVAALGGRMASAEGALVGMSGRVAEVEKRAVRHDHQITAVADTVGDLLENAPRAELVVGAVNHADGRALAFGAGLSLPVAKGDWRFQTEALGSVGSGTIGFTAIGRWMTAIGDSPFIAGQFVVGPNVRFHIEGPEFSRPASAVFAGVGVSAGWSGERFGVIADLAVGPQAQAGGRSGIAVASGLLAQVKF